MSNSARTTQPFGPLVKKGHARLIVVSGKAPAGLTFSLGGPEHKLGRGEVDVPLTEDAEVSPVHATLKYANGQMMVVDNGSANGIYLRVRGPQAIEHGDMFRVGDQFFRFEQIAQETEFVQPDGTHYFTSPKRKGTFRILQVLTDGKGGLASTSSSDEIVIGCENATVTFTADPRLSAQHAKIYKAGNGYTIEDLGSTNGTYVRIKGQSAVTHGDFLFVGDELLRVEVT